MIPIGYQLGYSGADMFAFLEGGFFFEANIRLPYNVFIKWVQLEIHCKNYDFASEVLIKPYIKRSTKFTGVKAINKSGEPLPG